MDIGIARAFYKHSHGELLPPSSADTAARASVLFSLVPIAEKSLPLTRQSSLLWVIVWRRGASSISVPTVCLIFQSLSALDIDLILAVWAVAGDVECFVAVRKRSSVRCRH